jgi:hypothetical protein
VSPDNIEQVVNIAPLNLRRPRCWFLEVTVVEGSYDHVDAPFQLLGVLGNLFVAGDGVEGVAGALGSGSTRPDLQHPLRFLGRWKIRSCSEHLRIWASG